MNEKPKGLMAATSNTLLAGISSCQGAPRGSENVLDEAVRKRLKLEEGVRQDEINLQNPFHIDQNYFTNPLVSPRLNPLNYGHLTPNNFTFFQRMSQQLCPNPAQQHNQFSDEVAQHSLLAVLDSSRILRSINETCLQLSEKMAYLEAKVQSLSAVNYIPSIPSLLGHDERQTDNAFYSGDKVFDFHLVLQTEHFPKPLEYSLAVKVVDPEGNQVENRNKISLKISLYSSDVPPKLILKNTLGKHILKGLTEKDVIKGEAHFEKIRISEVTSHLPKGWMYLVVTPTFISDQVRLMFSNSNSKVVEASKIKPLVVEKVIVKAKKYKNTGSHSKNRSPPPL